MFGLSPAQMIILLVVILLVFGTKKLRNAGSDLGAAVKGFKKAMSDDEPKKDAEFTQIWGKLFEIKLFRFLNTILQLLQFKLLF